MRNKGMAKHFSSRQRRDKLHTCAKAEGPDHFGVSNNKTLTICLSKKTSKAKIIVQCAI